MIRVLQAKMIDGKQMTITWHVDDLKVSHVDKKAVDDFIDWICKECEDVTKVKPSHGKVHDHLAMTMDCSTPGVLKVSVKKCIQDMISEFPCEKEIGIAKAKTPAADHLFKTREDCKKLDEEKREVFHTFVAKALFLCK